MDESLIEKQNGNFAILFLEIIDFLKQFIQGCFRDDYCLHDTPVLSGCPSPSLHTHGPTLYAFPEK